ncbi:MAG: ATP-binding cassette domain-containing protein, partial [Bdellovibrionota bacterium]
MSKLTDTKEVLRFEGVSVHYGAIHAIQDVSFSVNTGEIVTLIGANGAGKSTTLRAISGIVK